MKFFLFIPALIAFVIPIIRHFTKAKREPIPKMTEGKNMDCSKLKECLDMNNSWISNCDQKAGILIATIGVAFTIFFTSDAVKLLRDFIFQPFLLWCNDGSAMQFDFSRFSVFVFLLTTVVFAGISMWFLFNSIKPDIDLARLKSGSTADLMKSIEDRLADYALSDDAGCGELLRKALRYARAEWPAMKRVLESGDVEVSNNISEQSVRKLKMNLRNAGNIGSESSAADNAFMYSVIESCKLNDIDPGKYISYLLGKLKTAREGDDLTGLLPCYCGL